jgi:hypothetical protein
MILPCTCPHKAQDALHGPGKRVHNAMKEGNKARCTVCGAVKLVAVTAEEKK